MADKIQPTSGLAGATGAPDICRRRIIVSLTDHLIRVCESDRVVREITVFSTGREGHSTPIVKDALIDPDRRYRRHTSSLYKDHTGKPASMPYSLFFSGACAFHAGDTNVPSHGCIHLSLTDAAWLFDWVGKHEVHVTVQKAARTTTN